MAPHTTVSNAHLRVLDHSARPSRHHPMTDMKVDVQLPRSLHTWDQYPGPAGHLIGPWRFATHDKARLSVDLRLANSYLNSGHSRPSPADLRDCLRGQRSIIHQVHIVDSSLRPIYLLLLFERVSLTVHLSASYASSSYPGWLSTHLLITLSSRLMMRALISSQMVSMWILMLRG
ncbi:hypothetical protein BD289DRAFT_68021 [Coniella lustricola]|uniref:Uncharacterized protein n=1 Tax=Coniella lustricola TaxID=2025994 RepID=A0A2T3A057_9PEZI|nr:hypothetical protein BD289DRAFT_68021 [Coniella lustricola]